MLVYQAYRNAKIGDRTMTNEEFVARLSKMPLHFNPGDRWEYSVAVDVQGRLLEVLNGGKPLHEVLADRIFKPLGMVDTSFQVPADKMNRVAQPAPGTNGKPTTVRFKPDDGAKYELGGGGLLSTTDDYLRFTAALANGGTLNGKRIIGKQTLAFMTADHVGNRPGRPPGFGFGLGFEVRTAVGDLAQPGTVGEYGWSGAAGSTFWVDPEERAVRDLHDPGERRRHARPAHAVPDDGRSGTARLRLIAGTAPLRGAHDHEMSATGRRRAPSKAHEGEKHNGQICRGARRVHERDRDRACRRMPVPMAASPEEVGLSSVQLKRIEAVTKKQIDDGSLARCGHAGGAARQGRVGQRAGQARPGAARSDEARFDLPHLFDDQADRQHDLDAAGRGGPAADQRPGVEVPARDRHHEGRHRGGRSRRQAAPALSPIRRGR